MSGLRFDPDYVDQQRKEARERGEMDREPAPDVAPDVRVATPQSEELGVSTCTHCANQVKRVIGGQGRTWVHEDGYRPCGGGARATD